jgi:hypothetical protein
MAHWVDRATDIPENARAHFHRYHDIRTAWDKCPNGLYLIWLALGFGVADRAEIAHVAGVGISRLRNALDAHFRSLKTADRNDPLTLAYRDVIAEVTAVTVEGKPPASRQNPGGVGTSYEGYRADAALVIADALRASMHPPES